MKFKLKDIVYDIGAERIHVWQAPDGWRGKITKADGSGGISTLLMGANSEAQARQMLQQQVQEWLEDGQTTPQELGLTDESENSEEVRDA